MPTERQLADNLYLEELRGRGPGAAGPELWERCLERASQAKVDERHEAEYGPLDLLKHTRRG